jgi:hydrogenase maturation protease
MKIEQVKEIANAVLYEGYLLYPYRHSAIKNRQRWTIGVVYPREYSEANGGLEPSTMQTECLVTGQGNENPSLNIHIRFLHLLLHTTKQAAPLTDQSNPRYDGAWSLAGSMEHEPFEEGIEREVSIVDCSLRDLLTQQRVIEIDFPGQRIVEETTDVSGSTIVREQLPVSGTIVLSVASVDKDLFKLRVRIENRTSGTGALLGRHNEVFLQSFVSTHTIMQVQQGAFISLLEPPDALQASVQACQNLHTWPVLIGSEGERDVLLSSPIILYDYPQIAPESPGNLFDGTEIDEILTLRILTLTEDEKEQMRHGDKHAREILERTEALTPEQLMKLHGTMRSLRSIPEGDR